MKTRMRKTLAPFMASALALGFAGAVYAQEAETSASTTEMDATELEAVDLKEGEGLDEEIINARMRANSGSRSKVSMSASLGYNGGSIENPLDSERPNLSGDPTEETDSDLGGSVSARYRFTDKVSATFGAGVGVLKPFHGAEEMNIDNPSVGLSRYYKLGAFQTATSGSLTYGTSEAWKGADLDGIAGVSHNMMATLGDSGFTAGASVSLSYYSYGDDSLSVDPRTQMAFGLYPQLEYQFNDTFAARTVFGYFNLVSRRDEGAFDFERQYEYQSVGVGISVSRDIYLYPNIQLIPDNLSVENTNVGISATINLF